MTSTLDDYGLGTVMLLAAGFGKRMTPLSDTCPKALIPVLGHPLIDWAYDRFEEAGAARYIVNSHYLAAQIENHMGQRDKVTISHEVDILETGGGIKKALPSLGPNPFFAANADSLWLDHDISAVLRMAKFWDPTRMDGLLLLYPTPEVNDYNGPGDFHMANDGQLSKRHGNSPAPYVFMGVQILKPELYDHLPEGAFSNTHYYTLAEQNNKLFGLIHDGAWFHVGTPASLDCTEKEITKLQQKTVE
jgi:MurNAc alpha-1-phosphate uridylyltransferase